MDDIDDILSQPIDDCEIIFTTANEVYNSNHGIKGVQLFVRADEGPIPHFHFRQGNSAKDGCICFLTDKYFIHGSHTDTLGKDKMNALNTFLRSYHPMGTVWDMMVYEWNKDNGNNSSECLVIPSGFPIPNYKSSMKSLKDNKDSFEEMTKILSEYDVENNDILNCEIE